MSKVAHSSYAALRGGFGSLVADTGWLPQPLRTISLGPAMELTDVELTDATLATRAAAHRTEQETSAQANGTTGATGAEGAKRCTPLANVGFAAV